MGGCYSSDSETAVMSPRHKLPADRWPGHGEKGLQYAPLTNGDSQHQEDQILEEGITPLTANTPPPAADLQHLPENVEKATGVAPSDSGIESIGPVTEDPNCEPLGKKDLSLCRSCHNKLKRLSRGSCQQCGQFQLDTSELSLLVPGNTYCMCSGHRQAGQQSACLRHGTGSPVSYSPKRHSDIPTRLLKSNLKKQGQERGEGKHVRMSWKSADSLDLHTSMYTCMDRAKSEASDVFGDDVSFRAPLAQFDSVENQLDTENVDHEDGDVFFTSRMSIYSEILELADSICHCDFSSAQLGDSHVPSISVTESPNSPDAQARQPPLSRSTPTRLPAFSEQVCSDTLPEDDEDSGHGMSKSEGHLGSSSDCETEGAEEILEDGSVALCSSSVGYAAVNVLEKLSHECEAVMCPVSLVVKGRHLVMMDAKTYSQLLSDLRGLKQQLLYLSQILQEEERTIAVPAVTAAQN
ncbi:uncharacterized protein LOC143292362 [Babylonia areolata]|uniref:uncharacterized protein LOC143292362 n=1 Tax=Babylonia areolata TaxID=304850 RepID=UPI003FD31C5A